jgi:hypothetical protein
MRRFYIGQGINPVLLSGGSMNYSQVRKMIPFAVVFDISVAVAIFGGYIDPTLRIVGAVSCAVCSVWAMAVYARN